MSLERDRKTKETRPSQAKRNKAVQKGQTADVGTVDTQNTFGRKKERLIDEVFPPLLVIVIVNFLALLLIGIIGVHDFSGADEIVGVALVFGYFLLAMPIVGVMNDNPLSFGVKVLSYVAAFSPFWAPALMAYVVHKLF